MLPLFGPVFPRLDVKKQVDPPVKKPFQLLPGRLPDFLDLAPALADDNGLLTLTFDVDRLVYAYAAVLIFRP